jgi:hypothetical protein
MSVESEWKVGSTWRMYADGSLMDSGEILESVSQKDGRGRFASDRPLTVGAAGGIQSG